jgi:hypothetical protein
VAQDVDFLFLPPLSIPEVAPADQAMLEAAARRNYDLVIVNTLRKVHDLNDKEPQTPKVVYSYFQHLFPGTAIVFVHHTKKTQIDSNGNYGKVKESFSGAMNWLNDAQVGLCLYSQDNEAEGINIKLSHEKSQVSELYNPLGLYLSPLDGATLSCPKFNSLLVTYEFMNENPDLRGNKLDEALSKVLACSRPTAMRRRHLVEEGYFPGVKWLGRKDKGVEVTSAK